MSEPKFRTVNPLLGAKPSFGPIPADLLIPWGVISFSIFMITYSMELGWHWIIAFIVWGDASWWALTGSNAYQFLSKFMQVPKRWTRGYVRYRRLRS